MKFRRRAQLPVVSRHGLERGAAALVLSTKEPQPVLDTGDGGLELLRRLEVLDHVRAPHLLRGLKHTEQLDNVLHGARDLAPCINHQIQGIHRATDAGTDSPRERLNGRGGGVQQVNSAITRLHKGFLHGVERAELNILHRVL